MAGRLDDKTALVTGGTRGIGLAIAHAFVAEGARVIVVSRKEASIQAALTSLNPDGTRPVWGRTCHVGHADQIGALLDWVDSEVGMADVLVNNAGTNPYFGPMLGASPAAFTKTFDVNLRGPFELSRGMASRLMNAKRSGSIINIASILGQGASPLQGIYGMTKAALISMTQTMAVEWGGAGIRVNAIAPGLVDTRLAAAIVDNAKLAAEFYQRTALGRAASPDEIAGAALFLASDEAAYVTGHTLNVDAGYQIR
jgi:NAD(P)-dependent dehydrogenase (short-subunit alcohol dehydrogenase family)